MRETVVLPARREIEERFSSESDDCEAILAELLGRVRSALDGPGIRPTLKGRIKTPESYYRKMIRLLQDASRTGTEVLPINDIIAIRVVCPFLEDLEAAEKRLRARFDVTETERKGAERSFREFGYESIHLLVRIPDDILGGHPRCSLNLAEIQVRTILQDAWAEVEHELVYKSEFTPFDDPMKRKLAALNATLSLSDTIFQEIRDYQRRLHAELDRRRESFHSKIETEMESLTAMPSNRRRQVSGTGTALGDNLDEMLLEALKAHNADDFTGAIAIYSRILECGPETQIRAIILQHRGMAHFSDSRYAEAIADFSAVLGLDPACHKAMYYRGVVRCVLQEYTDAVADFTGALDINPYHCYSLFRRAQGYFHLGDFPKALSDCDKALKLEPDLPEAAAFRELILQKLKM